MFYFKENAPVSCRGEGLKTLPNHSLPAFWFWSDRHYLPILPVLVNVWNIFIVFLMRRYVPPEEHLHQGHTNCLIFSVPNKILFCFIFSDFCLSSFSHHLWISHFHTLRFKFLTMVSVKSPVFRDMKPCSVNEGHGFGGTFCPHLQDNLFYTLDWGKILHHTFINWVPNCTAF